MPTIGILGQTDLSAATIADVYTVPASTKAVFSVTVCNRGAVSATVRLALSTTTVTQAVKEFIEHGLVLGASGSGSNVAQITGITLQAAKILTAYSDVANVSVNVYGVEEAV